MSAYDAYQEYLKITDEVVNDAFDGTNFGRTDFRVILAEVVIKRAAGYHCGHTATTIAKELKLITDKTEKPTALGFQVVMDMFYRNKEVAKRLPAPSDETLCEVIRAWNRADIPQNAYPEMRKALGYPVEGGE